MHRPSRAVCLLGAGGVLVLALGLVAAERVASGRTRAPRERHRAALAAVEVARVGPAAFWAPEALRSAAAARDAALLEWSRELARLLPLARDFRTTSDALWRAETLAREATRLGEERREEARSEAEDALAEARRLAVHADALVATTLLPRRDRARLQRARLALWEAEGLLREGELRKAFERASLSRLDLRAALGPTLEAAERYTAAEQLATWRRWIEQTRSWSRVTGQPAILVLKEKNRLVLLTKGTPTRSYHADIGANAVGLKLSRGDRATPEGRYRVTAKKDRGRSRYHRALLLDYPNEADRKRFAAARRTGRIPREAAIGGLIEIHGEGGRGQNWTDGCVALSNSDMDDLYARIPLGTRVTIVGGDGRDGAFSALLARLTGDGGGNGR